MNEFEVWFILLNISNKQKIELIKEYNNEENIYNNISKIRKINGIKNLFNEKVKEMQVEENKKFVDYINKEGIGYITINSREYPIELKEIEEPPYVLFYKGNLLLFKGKKIGIVGARNYTIYGSEVAKRITREIASDSTVIVSGVAAGIDSIAHKIALEEKGNTIGVLGCGIDVIYPRSNLRLYKEIGNVGLLISEFLPGTKPMPYNFPRRNRIISGLCQGIIVVEASVKSGSLITATCALDQGKDVMAVPGSVLNESSSGCNKLIRDGAYVFTELDDLYILFNLNKKDKKNNTNNVIEKELLHLIGKEPKHLDDIVDSMKVDRKVLFGLLFEMQKRNEIICLPGNYYAKLT